MRRRAHIRAAQSRRHGSSGCGCGGRRRLPLHLLLLLPIIHAGPVFHGANELGEVDAAVLLEVELGKAPRSNLRREK